MSALTPSRLESLKSWPHLESNWHFLSATALSVSNQASEVPILYKYALENTPKEHHAKLTAQFRDAILKSAALIGLPRTINSLVALGKVTPEHLRATKLVRPDKNDFRKEGDEFFKHVYADRNDGLRKMLYDAYPDLDWFVVNFEYGPILSQTSVISPKDTSLVVIASLIPQDVDFELKGHLTGALHTGNSAEEVNSLRSMVMTLCSFYGIKFPNPVSEL